MNFIGEIRMHTAQRIPDGWALCDGSMLPIRENMPLFSLLSDSYGPYNNTHFTLPDMRSRVPIGFGEVPGFEDYSLGQKAGSETASEMKPLPIHYKAREAKSFAIAAAAGQSLIQPVFAIDFIIALRGTFPDRP